jgi:hypothetical protein
MDFHLHFRNATIARIAKTAPPEIHMIRGEKNQHTRDNTKEPNKCVSNACNTSQLCIFKQATPQQTF